MQPFSLLEVTVYQLIRAVPLTMMAFFPFREKRRFSASTTALFIELIVIIWVAESIFSVYYVGSVFYTAVGELLSFIVIASLYVAAIKAHPGKMLFFCFMLVNVGYLLTSTGKCLEGILFPDLALQRYRWSASLCLCLVSTILLPPLYMFLKWEKENGGEDRQPTYVWKFSWLVPTTFYLIWSHEFYGLESSLQWCLDPHNVLFVGLITFASFLIYYLILRMVSDNSKYIKTREDNYALAMQVMQYDEINERIGIARKIRHDMRHRLLGLEALADAGNIEGIRRYLRDVGFMYELDEAFTFCSNSTVNGILMYYAREAKRDNIDFKVQVGIPEEIPVARIDLSILFGNLVENAIEACRRQRAGQRRIHVRCQTHQNTFTLVVDNTFEEAPQKDRHGRFRSMKHSGAGIGTQSVRDIVERYHGVVQFETRGDLFSASVMLYLQ